MGAGPRYKGLRKTPKLEFKVQRIKGLGNYILEPPPKLGFKVQKLMGLGNYILEPPPKNWGLKFKESGDLVTIYLKASKLGFKV